MNTYIKKIKQKIDKNKPYRILALGSSIVSGEHNLFKSSMVIEYVLKEYMYNKFYINRKNPYYTDDYKIPYWNIQVVNLGIQGGNILHMVKNIKLYKSLEPDMIILQIGKNDIGYHKNHRVDIEKFIINLEKFVDNFQKQDILLVNIPPIIDEKLNQKVLDYNKIFVKITQNNQNIKLIDLYKFFKPYNYKKIYTYVCKEGNPNFYIQPGGIDFIHPNHYGVVLMGKGILKQGFSINIQENKLISDFKNDILWPRF